MNDSRKVRELVVHLFVEIDPGLRGEPGGGVTCLLSI